MPFGRRKASICIPLAAVAVGGGSGGQKCAQLLNGGRVLVSGGMPEWQRVRTGEPSTRRTQPHELDDAAVAVGGRIPVSHGEQ